MEASWWWYCYSITVYTALDLDYFLLSQGLVVVFVCVLWGLFAFFWLTFWLQIPRQVSAPDQKEVSTTLRWSLHCVPSLVEILDQLLRHCPQSASGGSWSGSPVQTQVLPQGMPYCVVTNWGIDQSETVFASQRSLAAKLSPCQSPHALWPEIYIYRPSYVGKNLLRARLVAVTSSHTWQSCQADASWG